MVINLSIWVPILQSLVTTVALCVGAYVGMVGLNTWRAQLRARADHDLARRLLVAVYRLRDTMRNARIVTDKERFVSSARNPKFHDEKLKDVDRATNDVEVELLEVEALWGIDAVTAIRRLISKAVGMRLAFFAIYVAKFTEPNDLDLFFDRLFGDSYSDEPDAFTGDLLKIVSSIEDQLRPRLLFRPKQPKGIWDSIFRRRLKQSTPVREQVE